MKEKRLSYGISQNKLALEAGISREYLNKIENGKLEPKEDLKEELNFTLNRLNPESPLTMLFDYVRIRFPTIDHEEIIANVLGVKNKYMVYEEYGFYSYPEHCHYGDIFICISNDKEKGTLLELKGKGCRQLENLMLAQKRTWYDFFICVFENKGVYKRIDLAINDKIGLLDIPELARKCDNKECVSLFRSFKSYRSGELINSNEQEKESMGNTLYIGSLRSEVYFCIYQKDYEQLVKYGIPLEETETKNRFEIRLKSERAQHAIMDYLKYLDVEKTAFDVINYYLRFVDRDGSKPPSRCPVNERWAWFIGKGRGRLKLTTAPEPYTISRTIHWINKISPTLKMVQEAGFAKDVNILGDMIENASLGKKHETILAQALADTNEVVI